MTLEIRRPSTEKATHMKKNCGINQSPPPPQPSTIVGYYPAYKYDLKADDFNISSSITHLNYIAFGPNDLINDTRPNTVFQNQIKKFKELQNYKDKNSNLNYKLILSVLLPVNDELMKLPPFYNVSTGQYDQTNQDIRNFIEDLTSVVRDYFDGIDIDYPNKASCLQAKQFNSSSLKQVFEPFISDISSQLKQKNSSKILTITGGINSIHVDPSVISFVNLQAYRLNIYYNAHSSAGIDVLQNIIDSWNFGNRSQCVLGIEFGGIIEAITVNNPNMDIANQNFEVVHSQNITFPSIAIDENITDPCGTTSFAHLTWKNFLAPLCYTNNSKNWNYNFDNKSKQPYIYQLRQNPPVNQMGSKAENFPGSPPTYYYISYEDYQSLYVKLNFVQNYNIGGVAIADITKDSQFINYISGNKSNDQGNFAPLSNINAKIGAIVGGVISSLVFIGGLAAAGFILYRRRHKTKNIETTVVTSVVAMFDYVGKEENDLSFKAGDVIEVLEKGDGPNDWWVGRLHGVIGEFPGE
ncbi:17266_t:CDS:2 [Cetraspora pellucida]|uniref:17266_t:CDS:1 n=1 Tax=Cetraspora pellucida TaxID=1433469 RepID=A0A9N8VVT3_9GLOM|nr:17266_t:CDS:2 [Cetraspora pellucida]